LPNCARPAGGKRRPVAGAPQAAAAVRESTADVAVRGAERLERVQRSPDPFTPRGVGFAKQNVPVVFMRVLTWAGSDACFTVHRNRGGLRRQHDDGAGGALETVLQR